MDTTNKLKTNSKARLLQQKAAVERIISSDDGKLLLEYLGDITFADIGVPMKDLDSYAFKQGQRSLLITLLQFYEKPASYFCMEHLSSMIRLAEGKI